MADFKKINIRNKRATFDYEILEEYIAGVVLVGTEIKSIRLGKASMVDCYCAVTIAVAGMLSMRPPKIEIVTFDRPFIYAIIKDNGNHVLFTGKVGNPIGK